MNLGRVISTGRSEVEQRGIDSKDGFVEVYVSWGFELVAIPAGAYRVTLRNHCIRIKIAGPILDGWGGTLRGSVLCRVFIGTPSDLGEPRASAISWPYRANLAASTPNLFGPNSFQRLEQSTHSVGHVFVWSDYREEVSEPWRRLTDF